MKNTYITKLLRHNPEDLKMDKYGYVFVNDLLVKIKMNFEDLEIIVKNDNKTRFSFNEDKTKIKANQGHSKGIIQEHQLTKITALQADLLLYHGTDNFTWQRIKESGLLLSMEREHVHWTADINVAKKRAEQRKYHNKSKTVIVVLNAKEYIEKNNDLFLSENNVYLTNNVETKHLTTIEE